MQESVLTKVLPHLGTDEVLQSDRCQRVQSAANRAEQICCSRSNFNDKRPERAREDSSHKKSWKTRDCPSNVKNHERHQLVLKKWFDGNHTKRFSFIDLFSDCFCCERVAVSIDCIQNEAQPSDQPNLGYGSKL